MGFDLLTASRTSFCITLWKICIGDTKEENGEFGPKKNASGESAGAFGYILITATLFAAVMLLAISQKKPESYSALILVGKSVPESIEANSTFTFGFEILNRGGKAGLYAYSVFLDGKQKTERKTVLEDGERRTFYEALIIDEKGEHKVSVIMVSPAQKTYEVFFKVETT